MAEFEVLSQDEQDETIVAFFLAQERDLHALTVSIERYQNMLKTLPPGPWRERIEQLLNESLERKFQVESIIEATRPQLPPPERIEAAKLRLANK